VFDIEDVYVEIEYHNLYVLPMSIVRYYIDENQETYHVLYKQQYDQVEIGINNHLVINEKLKLNQRF